LFLVYSGPAKSNPVTVKGVEGCTRSAGKDASTSFPRTLLAILHGKQARRTFDVLSCSENPGRMSGGIVHRGRLNGATGYGYGGSTIV